MILKQKTQPKNTQYDYVVPNSMVHKYTFIEYDPLWDYWVRVYITSKETLSMEVCPDVSPLKIEHRHDWPVYASLKRALARLISI